MAIHQGDVYWVQLPALAGAEPRIPHPQVVIQADTQNHDAAVATVQVCALTTNPKKISLPGNILLDEGEADLPKRSIIEVSKVTTIDKSQLGAYIGQLSAQRVRQIAENLRFVRRSFFDR